jgi:hypothetical protein
MAGRIVHVLEQSGAAASPAGLACVSGWLAAAAGEQRVLLVGDRRLAREARAVGVPVDARVGAARGQAVWNPVGFRRAVRRLGPVGRFHCWSYGATAACGWFWPDVPQTVNLMRRPSEWQLRLVQGSQRRGGWNLVSPARPISDWLQRRVRPGEVQTVPPVAALSEAWPTLEDDEEAGSPLRIALLSDPPTAGDARMAMLATGLAWESLHGRGDGAAWPRLLVHPAQCGRSRAEANLRRFGRESLMRQCAELGRPGGVVPQCDGVLVLGECPAAVALAARGGAAVLAEAHPGNAAILGEGAFLFPPGQAKRAAHGLTRLAREPGFAAQITPAGESGGSGAA